MTSSRCGSNSGMTPFCSLSQFVDVAFTAEDIVSDLGKTSSRCQSNITRANH